MKLLLDIADNKVAGFMEMIKEHTYVKTQQLSSPDAELFEEIKEIKKAFKNVDRIKAGKLKTRPIEDLLNEL
ncbi:MAG: hypothetical protein V4520_07305 [Bacteroidota bacterium]